MRFSVADVLAQLRAEGLAGPGAEDAAKAALADELREHLPWYVRTAVGVGAWLATAFLLGSLFEIAGLREDSTRVVAGALLIGAAVWVRRTASAEFLKQAAVATSFAGQGLILAGFDDAARMAVTGLIATLLSVALIWLMPDRVHRFLSTLVGVWAAAVATFEARFPTYLVTLAAVALSAYVWRANLRARRAHVAEMLQPVGYGLVVALFGLLLYGAMTFVPAASWLWGTHRYFPGTVTTAGITLTLLVLVWKVLEEHRDNRSSVHSFAVLTGVAALGASTLSSPGIIGGAAALVLAFDRRNRVLLGLAVVFLLVFGSVYYYSLHLTLLEKSGVLTGSGALLLAIRQRIAPDKDAPA